MSHIVHLHWMSLCLQSRNIVTKHTTITSLNYSWTPSKCAQCT